MCSNICFVIIIRININTNYFWTCRLIAYSAEILKNVKSYVQFLFNKHVFLKFEFDTYCWVALLLF